MRNFKISFAFLIVNFFNSSFAQIIHPFPVIDREPPRIIIDNDLSSKVIKLSELNIKVEIDQNIATTTMDLLFENTKESVLAGELYFPLGENEYIIAMQMEVNGKLRDAVPVEKAKGREVYEKVVRRKVDPALAELTKGNVFKIQIYPIPSKGFKRVVLKFQSKLVKINEALIVQVPLQFKENLKKFDLVVEVLHSKTKPVLPKNDLLNIEFNEWKSIFKAEKHENNFLANHTLNFSIPIIENQNFVLTKTKNDSESYFYATIYANQLQSIKPLNAKSILLYWDVSLSGKKRAISKEIEVLMAYFKKSTANKIKIITFANDIIEEKEFTTSTIPSIEPYLKSLTYDGGTLLNKLNLKQTIYDQIILCSDGIQSWGKNEPAIAKTPIYVLSSVLGANYTWLENSCTKSGGKFINLENTLSETAVQKLQDVPLQFIGTDNTNDLIMNTFASIENNDRFSFTGILKGTTAKLNLKFGYGNQVQFTIPLTITKTADNELTDYLWAMEKIKSLNTNYEFNKSTITELGKKYKIVTQNTSLIILDNVQDYVTHQITPPAELFEEYTNLIKKKNWEKENESKSHLETVVTLFNERKEWWNTVFTVVEKKPENKEDKVHRAAHMDFFETESVQSQSISMETPARATRSNRVTGSVERGGNSSNEINEEISDMTISDMTINESVSTKKDNSTIQVKKFESTEEYIQEIKAWQADYYNNYLKLRDKYENIPVFYLDVAQLLAEKGLKKEALRVVTNLAELETENHELIRALAYKIKEWKEYSIAIELFEEICKMRAEEPQSFRDLGLVNYLANKPVEAITNLYKVVTTKWDVRFPEIEMIALVELNNIISISKTKLETNFIDKRLIYAMPCDIRIIIEWNYDNSDIDLWVTDPRGEKCVFNHNRTEIGGRMSKDFTGGYGPEEFLLKRAIPGNYKIEANYYGNSREKLTGPATISAKLTTHYGTSLEKTEELVIRLKSTKEVVELGTLNYK